jgi:crossover junction endodeoxyribonuclease RuvC
VFGLGAQQVSAGSAPVLGIDPGLSCCGYGAIVRTNGAHHTAVACGVLRTDPAAPLPDRLALLAEELDQLVDEIRPAAVVVERVLFQVNARTAISVGQASGLALVAAARRGIPVVQYSPNEVKLAIAGDGAAGKREVGEMVARLLRLPEPPRPADAADALALALCHAWRMRVPMEDAANVRSSSRLQAAVDRAQRSGSDEGATRRGASLQTPLGARAKRGAGERGWR